jgi:hypothetical protein
MTRALNLIDRLNAMMRGRRPGVTFTAIACMAILTLSFPAMAKSITGRWINDENQTVEVLKSGDRYLGYYRTGPGNGNVALQVRDNGTGGFHGKRTKYGSSGSVHVLLVGVIFAREGNGLELRNCVSNPCWLETWRRAPISVLDKKILKPKIELAGSKHGCTVYLDPNGTGQRWDAFVTIPRAIASKRAYSKLYNASSAWDRRISSLKCEASSKVDCYVAIYGGTERSGDNAVLYGRMGLINLNQFGWDDRVRSLEVFCSRK